MKKLISNINDEIKFEYKIFMKLILFVWGYVTFKAKN